MGLCGNDPPDPATGYISGIRADLETMPEKRKLEAAALLGIPVDVNMPGKYGGQKTYDFTGLGEADYASQYADKMMGEMLSLQREYGPQFVEQRLAELQAADPEGAAMRSQLWDSIRSGVEGGPTDRADLQSLQDTILGDLEGAGTLDARTSRDISQRVLGRQVGRGNFLGNAAATQEAGTLVAAGEQQRSARQQQAMAFLTGGMSPTDAAYREQQQNLANLGSFMAGETPIAQFSQLSGAQNGAAPFTSTKPQVGVNPNAGWQGVQYQQQVYGLNQQAQGVNPWIAGLSGGLQGASVYSSFAK